MSGLKFHFLLNGSFLEGCMSPLPAFSRLTAECKGYSSSRNTLSVDTSSATVYCLSRPHSRVGCVCTCRNRGWAPFVTSGELTSEEGSNEDTMSCDGL